MTTQPATRMLRCTNCQAPIEFDAGAGALKCQYCGSTQLVETQGPVVERDLREASLNRLRGYGRTVKGQRCSDCGARVAFEPNALAAQCPFCASVHVADGDAEGLRPENVIPFSVTPQQAVDLFKRWIRGLWFRPNDLKHVAELQELRGVYLPFWVFDAEARSWWSADAGYNVDQGSSRRRRSEERVRWEPASGTRVDSHRHELVCASQGLPRPMLQKLYPFQMERLVAYAPELLAGWAAEAAATDADEAWHVAKEALDEKQRARCASVVPGDTHRKLHVSTEYAQVKVKSALLPVHVAAYTYRGRTYRFLANGQTGKVTGEAAWSAPKILLAVLTLLLAVGGIALWTRAPQPPTPTAHVPAPAQPPPVQAPPERPAQPPAVTAPAKPVKAPGGAPQKRKKTKGTPGASTKKPKAEAPGSP